MERGELQSMCVSSSVELRGVASTTGSAAAPSSPGGQAVWGGYTTVDSSGRPAVAPLSTMGGSMQDDGGRTPLRPIVSSPPAVRTVSV